MSDQEKDFERFIADQLREAGMKFATQKALAGLAPDFIVYAPDGRQFAFVSYQLVPKNETGKSG